MTKKSKSSKRRTQVKDLPKGEKRLSKGEQRKVKGGALPSIVDQPGVKPKQ